ncbi:hypothetical protein MICAE_1540034 [Microcystis aeruginosa PCC 9806]|uniref:Uncharacterized protein n=1 Tax=Microcystis aeruginosa PCC 9806 TaxID=1160282 RepID=I4GSX2_MICAE|nr:hypothetical protein MICAE_1540034 [Microcystis aeruginosa PCC 9806]
MKLSEVHPVNLADFSAYYVDKTISFSQRSANHLCPSVIERKPKPLCVIIFAYVR